MIKDVLVHVDSTSSGKARLEYALDLASRFEARLTGMHVLAPVDVPPIVKPHAVEHIAENLVRRAVHDAAASGDLFARTTSGPTAASRWLSLEGHMAELICEQARCADLVVLGQYEAEGIAERRPLCLAEEVVLGAGRPVLVVPESLRRPFQCNRVLVGWDGSRGATRAVHDALPLLVGMKPQVEVLAFEEPGRTTSPLELTDHLRRHGLAAEVCPQIRADGSQGAALVKQLDAGDFDLLVIGAYGHPLWLQLLFGGTTKSVLTHAPTPVLISR